jgi:heat shock protein HtpX
MGEPWLFDEQVRHNKRATVRLFVIMFLILWSLVFSIGYVFIGDVILTSLLALAFTLVYLAVAGGGSVQAVLKAARARPANPAVREEKLLIHRVEEMSIAAGIPMPKVYVQESKDINAFATGRSPEEGVVCVTTGALALLDQEELEGVIAHEISHIKNFDIRIATYAVALIGIIAMIAEIMIWALFFGGGSRGGNKNGGPAMLIMLVVVIVLIIVAPILSRITYLAISRKREYLADATGVQLSRNPDGLARALAKISGTEPQGHRQDRTVAGLYLANPFKRTRKTSVWATHPPIDERIERLRRM